MTPVDFMNLYREAWNDEPTLRPSINNIADRLENVQMVPVYRNEDNQDQYNDIDISINTNNKISCVRYMCHNLSPFLKINDISSELGVIRRNI
ncbi:15661_t:CDS:2 [Cetraspora pellucida]|uniref:15661_t:CDS:1 n=1 Tax=Cetraspora pellucida TaxID=1433469 RepID=A0A9N8WKF9_9GLOM|nr:15661_t:CDS:2 [Cetraspora pellucida]